MMLYLGDPDAPLDFTGKPQWGHALHAHTWNEEPEARDRKERKAERAAGVRRYSFMIHSQRYPANGLKIRYDTPAGPMEAEIYDSEPCRDPDDMFTVFVKITDRDRIAHGAAKAPPRSKRPRSMATDLLISLAVVAGLAGLYLAWLIFTRP